MIKHLTIENFVLINNAEFDFTKDLNILIGETGGGKSLVFRAIGQVLGERAQASYIKQGQGSYVITASFTMDDVISSKLIQENIEATDLLEIKRYFDQSGNSKIQLNGQTISLKKLRFITQDIADMVLQQDNNQILSEDYLFSILNVEQSKYSAYQKEYRAYLQIKKEFKLLSQQKINQEEEMLIVNHRLKQFEKLDDNIDLTRAKEKVDSAEELLANQKKYKKIANNLDQALSFLMIPNNVETEINDELYQIKDSIENLSFKLSQKISDNISEKEINHLRDNLSLAKKLARQFSCNIDELVQMKERLNEKKQALTSIDMDLQNIENKLYKQKANLLSIWLDLKIEIDHSSSELSQDINSLFGEVEMPKATVKYALDEMEEFGPLGKYELKLLIDANGLNEFSNVNDSASGGEFSRLLLILKSLDQKNQQKLLMFDEIDTGISGFTAQRMICLIQKIAKQNQIILITHLAQSAAAAQNLYEIRKNGGTSSAHLIDTQKMPYVISKLLSGSAITDEAINQAKILIKEVNNG